MSSQPKVLIISSEEEELSVLEQILSEHVVLHSVRDLGQLESRLEDVSYDAVFCGWSIHRGAWNDALGRVRLRNPDLPVVVFCRTGGEREWVDVLEAGAFDLLAAPYGRLAVLSVLEQAVASYEARRSRKVISQFQGKAS